MRSSHIGTLTGDNVRPVMVEQIKEDSVIMTDDATCYRSSNKDFIAHHTVKHSVGEYVLGGYIHTNTVEGYFSILKRGLKGVYHHCSAEHLKRYLAEFDFRYNNREALEVNDTLRAENALRGIVGKRLMYKTSNQEVTI